MAKLRKRGKTWYSDLRVNGQRVVRALSTDRKVAEEKLLEMVKARNAERHGHAVVGMSWEPFKVRYLAHSTADKHYQTLKWDQAAIRSLESFRPLQKLSDVTPELLADWVKSRQREGLAPSSVNRSLRAAKAMVHYAERLGWLPRRDWSAARGVEEPRGRVLWYEQPDLEKMRQLCHGHYLTAFYLGFTQGLRPGEIHHLLWEDVDFGHQRVFIRPKAGSTPPCGCPEWLHKGPWRPKRNKSRTLPLVPQMADYLKTLKKEQEGPWVFGGNGERPTQPVLEAYYSKLVRKAGLKGSLYTLRHSFASHLLNSGVPLKVVSELLGHSSVAMTEIYAHLAPSTAASAVRALPWVS